MSNATPRPRHPGDDGGDGARVASASGASASGAAAAPSPPSNRVHLEKESAEKSRTEEDVPPPVQLRSTANEGRGSPARNATSPAIVTGDEPVLPPTVGAAAEEEDEEENELEFPCPVCLINPDDALVGGKVSGMCSECGQTICGECNAQDRVGRLACCPTCRASIAVSDSTYFTRYFLKSHIFILFSLPSPPFLPIYVDGGFPRSIIRPRLCHPPFDFTPTCVRAHSLKVKRTFNPNVTFKTLLLKRNQSYKRCTKLVYGRSVGRHTPRAQSALATLYNDGKGVKEDKQEAVRLWRLAAAGGSDQAAYNLAVITQHGKGTCVGVRTSTPNPR